MTVVTYIPHQLRPVKIVGPWRQRHTRHTIVENVEPNGGQPTGPRIRRDDAEAQVRPTYWLHRW